MKFLFLSPFLSLALLSFSSISGAQTPEPQPIFEIMVETRTGVVFGSVFMEQWKPIKSEDPVDISKPKLHLYTPGASLFAKETFTPIEENDKLLIVGEQIALLKSGAKNAISGFEGFLVGCLGDSPSFSTCYRFMQASIKFKSIPGSLVRDATTKNSKNLIFILAQEKKGDSAPAVVVISSTKRLALEAQQIAIAEKLIVDKRAAQEQLDRNNARQVAEARASSERLMKLVAARPKGSSMFCNGSAYDDLRLDQIALTCRTGDVTTPTMGLATLMDMGWSITQQNMVAGAANMAGGNFQTLNIILKKTQ